MSSGAQRRVGAVAVTAALLPALLLSACGSSGSSSEAQSTNTFHVRHAEDRSRVLALDQQAEVPFGHFRNVILTEDYSPVEPNVLELKMYARGIGQVLAQTVSGGSEREELISFTK
jgi:hypothetical protein